MKFTRPRFSVLILGLLVLASSVLAHHGTNISYDHNKPTTLNGTVTEFVWSNPHCQLYFDVKDASGKVVNWAFENSNVSTLARQGYNRNTLHVGQEITAVVNPSAQGAPRGIVVKVILADGSEIMSRSSGANPVD